jgi:hypothetical protein
MVIIASRVPPFDIGERPRVGEIHNPWKAARPCHATTHIDILVRLGYILPIGNVCRSL